ncbi:MAG: hypothetical protein HYS06_13280 [Methylocystis sp.]|nr:hypothetical protein [Methylocystis sp.]
MTKLDSLQGIVAKSSERPLLSILLFRIGAADNARAFLRHWLRFVPDGRAPPPVDAPELYFLFSWDGVSKLLAGHPTLKIDVGRDQLEGYFTNSDLAPDNPARAPDLGFVGDSAPQGWWEGKFLSAEIELALYCCFADDPQQGATLAEMRQSAAASGLQELTLPSFPQHALSGARPPDGVLHFGFRDGVTQPKIDWEDKKMPGEVDRRQFVIGYPSEAYPVKPLKPGPWLDFARDGCFAGLTWLYQDVARFNRFLRDNATTVAAAGVGGDAQEWLAAKLMGRWRDGSPLARYPTIPPAAPDLDDAFGYADDPRGEKCPLAAHIRVANLRDQGLSFGNQVRFPDGPPRLQRRGFSYGSRLDGVDDDGGRRGLVGVFLFARINEQFHTVLRWMQATDFSDAFRAIPNGLRSQDSVVGNRDKRNANSQAFIPLSGGRDIEFRLQNFVRFQGVKTFFVPSLKTLGVLAGQWS